MSKGNRNRELRTTAGSSTETQAKLSKLQLVKQQEKKEKTKKIIAWSIVALIVVAVIVGIVVTSCTKSANMRKIVAKSEHYEIDNSMVAYVMYNEFQQLYTKYGSYLESYFGLDTTRSLDSQNPSGYASMMGYNTKLTWYENFAANAMASLKELVALAEEATAKGYKLEDSDLKTIQENIDSIKASAKAAKYSTNKYLEAIYADGVTLDTLERFFNLQTLASKYYQALTDSYEFSDEECEKYVSENKSSFYDVSYIYYDFNADISDEATDEEKAAAMAAAKELADKFAEGVTDEESILAAIEAAEKDKEQKEKEAKDAESESAEPAESGKEPETEKEKTREDYTKSFVMDDATYSDTSEFGKWAWDKEAGAVTVIEKEGTGYTVYFLKEAVHRDETATRDVRHILVPFTSGSTDEETAANKAEAKAKAEELLAKWKEDPTEDNFAKLAGENSTDTGSKEKGGLYEKVKQGDMVTNFNNWLFALEDYAEDDRKPGDTGIVESTYGWHVMYYVGENIPTWQSDAIEALTSSKYSEDIVELKKTYPLDFSIEDVILIPSR